MDQKTIFEQLGGTYIQQGDYLLPNLKMPEQPEYNIGVWGQRRRRYLKQLRPILYTNLLTSCKLSEHLAEVEKECSERMAWVRRMNNICNRAQEIVLNEIVYV